MSKIQLIQEIPVSSASTVSSPVSSNKQPVKWIESEEDIPDKPFPKFGSVEEQQQWWLEHEALKHKKKCKQKQRREINKKYIQVLLLLFLGIAVFLIVFILVKISRQSKDSIPESTKAIPLKPR